MTNPTHPQFGEGVRIQEESAEQAAFEAGRKHGREEERGFIVDLLKTDEIRTAKASCDPEEMFDFGWDSAINVIEALSESKEGK